MKLGNREWPDFKAADSKYVFDTRVIRHKHLKDNTIVRLDTLERFDGKTSKGKITEGGMDTIDGII